ncbi:MAG: LCP family protein [Patescibacteria group bacterium]|jgi:anionic cell wall polymer biosynthesis LytR-Cps2A-Psr (LCP) family protein
MWLKRRMAIHVGALIFATTVVVGFFAFFTHEGYQAWRMDAVIDDVLVERTQALIDGEPEIDFGTEKEINILLLGLDARAGYENPHCDAIHLFTLNIEDWTVHITSVPRGTYAYIPPGNYADTEYYLANACAYAGLDYGIAQIEKVVGVKADYYVTVGFSQVLGILRTFEMPTTESLQWLRHRQSYAIGDPQRSHNQAVFMKDMILNQGSILGGRLSTPLLYLLYSMVDTNMDFSTMQTLVQGFLAAEIVERPEAITLEMKPYFETVDYHLDLENPDAQIEQMLLRVAPYLSKDDLSGKTLSDVQDELMAYLDAQLELPDGYLVVMEQELWRQVEDEEKRETYQYQFLEQYVYATYESDYESAVDAISLYLMEKQVTEATSWEEKGKGLLAYIVSKHEITSVIQ